MRILTVNAGSTSLKIERYDLSAPLPPIASPPKPDYAAEPPANDADTEAALRDAIGSGVDAVAHRFVQLPDAASSVFALDDTALARIKAVAEEDPLHDAAALGAVDTVKRVAPHVPQFGLSDSAFHRTMPPAATTYALPRELVGDHLHRIGYHGLSHEYAAYRACALLNLDVARTRVVTAHLGGGSSLCAVRNGESIDTTMGYTALEGVPMATRSGSIDPGLILRFLRNGMSPDELADTLERRSGLLGISGRSGDVRDLSAAAAGGDLPAALALDVLAWRVRAALGAMIAVLGGVDVIAFTGGIGEHAAPIRASILEGGLGIGAALDQQRNVASGEGRLDASTSTTALVVVAARENWQLARLVAARP